SLMTPQINNLMNQPTDGALVAVQRQTQNPPQTNQVKFVPEGAGAAYWGPGELMTFLITGAETGGAFFVSEISVAPGGGTPPHIHQREDESFRMIEGTLTIQVGGNTIT